MSEKMPLVSVVMPVYNDEKYVEAAVRSILKQTLDDFEFIIINDGSTDRSREIVKKITDPRILLIDNSENRGRAHAVNCGFEIARGKYIAEMDADDVSLPDRLLEQYKYMEQNKDIACCGTFSRTLIGTKTYPRPQITDPLELQAWLLWHSPLAHSSWFIRGTEIRQGRVRYDEHFPLSQDYELMVRMMKKWKLGCVPKELLLYRVTVRQRTLVDPYTVKVTTRILRSLHIKNARKNALLMRQYGVGDNIEKADYIALLVCLRQIMKNNRRYSVFDQAALKNVVLQEKRKIKKQMMRKKVFFRI